MTLKERTEIAKQKRNEYFKDIYAECEKNGCDIQFIDAFKARMFISPLAQTKAFMKSVERNYKYSFDPIGKLAKWKVFLSAVIKFHPEHEKINEWKEALHLLEDD